MELSGTTATSDLRLSFIRAGVHRSPRKEDNDDVSMTYPKTPRVQGMQKS
jgi:hypothetical protein